MPNRNEERLGLPPGLEEPVPPSTGTPEPASELSFVVPTDFVDLPSQGAFYAPSHPLHNQKSVEIKYMTAKEEDILTSRNYIEKGVVLDRLVQSILIDRSIDVGSLLSADKSAILINARKNGYGETYTAEVICPGCDESHTLDYDLNEIKIKNPKNSEELVDSNITATSNGTYLFTLPLSNVEVEFRLLTSRDEMKMLNPLTTPKKKNEGDHFVTDQLKAMIVAAMTERDRSTLARFVNSLTLKDSVALREAYETVAPIVEMRKEFVCSECDYEDNINFPFTTEFFWPQR